MPMFFVKRPWQDRPHARAESDDPRQGPWEATISVVSVRVSGANRKDLVVDLPRLPPPRHRKNRWVLFKTMESME